MLYNFIKGERKFQVKNKLSKLRRHASRIHFALIHFGKIRFGKINFWLYTLRKYTPSAIAKKCKSGSEVVWSGWEVVWSEWEVVWSDRY